MSKKKLRFGNVIVNEKEFHFPKKCIALNLVHIDKMVIFGKFKHSPKAFKYFVGYEEDDIIKHLCIFFTSNEWIHKTFW